jgi:hypothetical protein
VGETFGENRLNPGAKKQMAIGTVTALSKAQIICDAAIRGT